MSSFYKADGLAQYYFISNGDRVHLAWKQKDNDNDGAVGNVSVSSILKHSRVR